ncbi:MAG TPA: CHAD domain-containing protein [Pyrinomonadaceae bacterium]
MAKAKRIKGIDCNDFASAGIKLVLRTRFGELTGFRAAALDWTDPEGVHSMRVASRRLRSVLRDFMPYVRKQRLTPVLKQLRNLAATLGEVRDQDVAIMALEKLASLIHPEYLSTLTQYIEKRKAIRDEARKELTAILEENQLKQLETAFLTGVDEATAIREPKTDGTQSRPQISYSRMSRVIILDRLKELEKLSHSLFKPFEIETLHDMRIAAKRLRYAIELFQQCWGHSIATYAKHVARLQTALGELHDCDVWIESFGSEVTKARKQKQTEQVAAFIWLLSHFVKLRTKHLREAFHLWRDWEAEDMSDKLRAALEPATEPVAERDQKATPAIEQKSA